MLESTQTRAELNRLLQERNEYPERSPDIDAQIQALFEQDCAILVLDMSGFSRLTIRHGIIHFLAMVHRMNAIATPLVQHHSGRVVKQEADNLFAVFPTVQAAIDSAVDILKGFAAVNTGLPEEQDLYAGMGIGYGKTLLVGENDLFGSEMNLACKLGEDLARRGEVLLTEAAFKQIEAIPDQWERLNLSVSSLELIAYKLKVPAAVGLR
ncbi:adenylate/guanylate cyclase domain-containing protein [Stenomitos frigidus]|uniref:Adenylate/guanylate cyclase domain-containing protein n=1 Tax=Stenomitos frigidus ULC18 TaxID=2107698 RepID=A0A2T1E744_9CYAN|nr:adenylate/guanylate cyclase domain-containing protein [Stenomitos frigidus]PSB28556.1 adenylate/guanylate cyclase domain-containing protein [Stenomitos frigidus ULC18]